MVEPGMYLDNNGKKYYVGAVKDYKDKTYAYLIDEENEFGFFVEVIEENDGCRFNRVKSEELVKLLIVEFSDIKNVIKEELENGD